MRALWILAATPLALGACQSNWEKEGHAAQSSGQGAARSFDATGFTGVDLRGSDDVDVRIGQAWSVRAEGDPKVLDQLEIRVVDNMLRVGRKGNDWNWGSDHGVKVHVTLPKLAAASVAGSGNLNIERAEGDFRGSVAGSGNLDLQALSGGTADLSVAGSGNLNIAGGQVSSLDANIAGSGDIDARGLTATSARVAVAGSGNVRATVNGNASVSIIGSGDAELGGGAKCTVSKVGSGDARCGG